MRVIWSFCLLGTAVSLSLDSSRVAARGPWGWSPPSSVSSFPSSLPTGSPGFPRSCNYRSYTALGDSYSAGLNYANGLLLPSCDGSGAPCNGGEVCLRNADAFPVLMQNAHNFSSFQFLACSGANTTDCDVNQVKSSAFGSPDLVTITIGGDNNQAFLGLIINCVYQRDAAYCQAAIQNAQYTISTIDSYLNSLFLDILTTNSAGRRRVVVVGYPRLWSTTGANACQHPVLANVPASDRQTMNDLADGVNTALKKAARKYGMAYADADPLFEGNRLCDNVVTPYFQYDFSTAVYGVFHPTEVGQQALFKVVDAAAGCAAN